jgi:hypothetical protein
MSSRQTTRSNSTPSGNTGSSDNLSSRTAVAGDVAVARRRSTLRSNERNTKNRFASADRYELSPLKINTQIVEHPYLDASPSSRRRPLTLSNILQAERHTLRELKRRSGWRVYPRGPSRCFTQIKARGEENDSDEEDDNETPSSSSPNSSSSPDSQRQMGRVRSLTLNDLTVYALLEVLDTYLHNNRRWRPNLPRPAVPPTPPPWTMPDDIAILDQLQTMELFQCTGALPDSMNHLVRLKSLKLRSCHGLQMNALQLMQLKELEVTDSEGIVPTTFAGLPNLERVKLYRIASSDANTRTIGRDWIQDLKQNDFAWNGSLKDLCFCAAGLENEDLATLLVDTLPHKFPKLRSVFIISNTEITSFQHILTRWEEVHQQNGSRFVPPPLRVLSLTGTRISKTVPEMQHIQQFLKLYHEIGLFMMVTLPPTLRADVVRAVHQINHQLTLNRAGGPVLFSSGEDIESSRATGNFIQGSQQSLQSSAQAPRRRPLPLSMWPVVFERAMNLEYVPCYESGDDGNTEFQRRRRAVAAFGQGGEAVMQRVDRVVARARMLFQDRPANANNNNNNNANNNANNNNNNNNNPVVVVIPMNNNNNDDDANGASEDDATLEENWMETPQAFSERSRYDAIYHLLRHGPVLLSTSDHRPRCRRQRSFMARKCKRVKLF